MKQYPSNILPACLGVISDGMQFGWPSPAVPILLTNTSYLQLTKDQSAWITNWYILGNIFGLLVSIVLFKQISRKLSLSLASLPVLVGWCGLLLANTPFSLYLARFIAGIGRNMVYVTVPMYICEIADPGIRGALGSFIYIAMNIGVILVYGITPYFPLFVSGTIGLSIALLQLVLVSCIPESPYYLLMKKREVAARRSLQRLRREEDVEEELEALVSAVTRQTQEKGSFFQLFSKRSNRKALGIMLFLRFAQMMTGVSTVTMHIHSVFEQAGGKFSSETSALIYGFMMLVSCLCTMGLMDKYGRKPLMSLSCFTTAIILLLLGVYFYAKLAMNCNTDTLSWLPTLLVVAFVFSYRFGLGTVPMVMVGELFAANVKVTGVVMSDLMYSISSFSSNYVFQYTEDRFGMYAPFFVFASVCFGAAAFSYKCVPETRSRTLEEIQFLLMNKQVPERLIEKEGYKSTER